MLSFDVIYDVERVVFKNSTNDFCIIKAKNVKIDEPNNKNLDSFIIKGIFTGVAEKDTVKSICRWTNDSKYGWQLISDFAMIMPPSNIRGIRRFLDKHVSGVGIKTIDRILSVYKEDTLNKIKESVLNLTSIPGIGRTKAELIREQIIKNEEIEELAVYLFQNGITNYNDVVAIYDALESDAVLKLKTNPYCICDCTSISKLPLADKIALGSGMSVDDPIRCQKLVHYYLYVRAFETGNMYEYRSSVIENIFYLLRKRNLYIDSLTNDMIENAISLLASSGQIRVIEDSSDQKLYLAPMYKIESGIVDCVRNINARKNDCSTADTDSFYKSYEKDTGIIPDESQKLAVINAYTNRLSILTGNPGTGKTQTVKAIISFIEFMQPTVKIALCSPTGRAAQRMSELTGYPAKTIHRYLGLIGNDMDLSKDIEDDYVIVDESSMIDSPLFYKLLLAVSRSGASLVLVGDKDQLAPVGPGLPFKELIQSGVVPTVILDKLHRQASKSQINLNAKKVLNGVDGIHDQLLCDRTKQDFFMYPLRNDSDIQKVILRIIDTLISLGTPISEITVLSPMRKSSLGTHALNTLIQNHINPASSNKPEVSVNHGVFRVGDKIMQIKNNYETEWHINNAGSIETGLGVYNGDLGTIQAIDNIDEKIQISFDDGRIAIYTFSMLPELELSYAMTIHKAQGSEMGCVIMPVHPCLINLSRNIIYTAITRSRDRFLIPGDPKVLYNGIAKTDNMKRNTDVALLLCDTQQI